MVAAGEPLSEIERFVVESSSLDREARDALWLYAWAATERAGRGY